MQDIFLVTRDELLKLVPEVLNSNSEECKKTMRCVQDKVKADSYQELATLLVYVD